MLFLANDRAVALIVVSVWHSTWSGTFARPPSLPNDFESNQRDQSFHAAIAITVKGLLVSITMSSEDNPHWSFPATKALASHPPASSSVSVGGARVGPDPNEADRASRRTTKRKECEGEEKQQDKRVRGVKDNVLKTIHDELDEIRRGDNLWKTVKALGVCYNSSKEDTHCLIYKNEKGEEEDFKGKNSVDFLPFFCEKGIPNLDRVEDAFKRRCLETAVRFAHVNISDLRSAKDDLPPYDDFEIPTNENILPYLEKYGFEPNDDGSIYPPGGKDGGSGPMTLEQIQIYIRGRKSLHWSGRRLKKSEDSPDFLAVRVWAAMADDDLPVFQAL
jgi:hypothetical protein